MESTTELILHGHFSKLRDAVNQQADTEQQSEEIANLLKQLFDYFNKMEKRGRLDTEGRQLHDHMAAIMKNVYADQSIAVPGKLPMQKAKGKRSSESQKKTGT